MRQILHDGKERIQVDVEGVCYNCDLFYPKYVADQITRKCKKQCIYHETVVVGENPYWIIPDNKACPHIRKHILRDKLDQI